MNTHSNIIEAANFIAANNPRDCHINGGGRYLLAAMVSAACADDAPSSPAPLTAQGWQRGCGS